MTPPRETKTYRMTIRNAPPGVLLLRDGTLVFKTEYARERSNDPQCYCLESGENYCDDLDVDCIEVTDDFADAARAAWETP